MQQFNRIGVVSALLFSSIIMTASASSRNEVVFKEITSEVDARLLRVGEVGARIMAKGENQGKSYSDLVITSFERRHFEQKMKDLLKEVNDSLSKAEVYFKRNGRTDCLVDTKKFRDDQYRAAQLGFAEFEKSGQVLPDEMKQYFSKATLGGGLGYEFTHFKLTSLTKCLLNDD